MHRFIFWCLTAITCAVVFFSVQTGAQMTGAIMSTTGNVSGVVVGSAPDLVTGFRDGVNAGGGGSGGGNGGGASILDTFGNSGRQGGGQQQQAAPRRPHTAPVAAQRTHRKHHRGQLAAQLQRRGADVQAQQR